MLCQTFRVYRLVIPRKIGVVPRKKDKARFKVLKIFQKILRPRQVADFAPTMKFVMVCVTENKEEKKNRKIKKADMSGPVETWLLYAEDSQSSKL